MKGAKKLALLGCVLAAGVYFAGRQVYTTLQAEGREEALPQQAPPAVAVDITALGRLEPRDGVIRLAGPSHPAVVIDKLFIDDGDPVKAGQTIAILDNFATLQANVAQLEAELKNAEAEWRRNEQLFRDGFVSPSERDTWKTKVETLRAQLDSARAELERAVVRSPIDGQVLEVHAREGEKVGPDGIAELGQTQAMYAIAEVYETDIAKVRVGQRATISSPALAQPVHGTVERVGLKVGKKDVLAVDPAAKTDARVIEVEILLDEDAHVGGLTNLEVDVAITP